ncbi:MAG: homoserine dehydrogenase [Eubacteriales bacterium]|nr:homoserine dehydrogenase [Eubacteriales bacterium]
MINLAILGYGIVGSGVAEVCQLNGEAIRKRTGQSVQVRYILDIRDFPGDPFADRIVHDPDVIFNDPEIAVVVETIGGSGIALELTRRALRCGKHVVTSNKELVARHGPELIDLAREHAVSYLFEASVGGGIPIIRPLHKCLAANRIDAIAGILNGTTNYILTRMRDDGIEFDQALAEAQANGYAEKNPSADVEGIDAARKISILGSIALGHYIDSEQIYCEGISQITPADIAYATDLDCQIKLIGKFTQISERSAELMVAPMLLPSSHPLSMANDVFNAIMVVGNALGDALFYGRGAGKLPTASAVVADVIDCIMHLERIPHMSAWQTDGPSVVKPHSESFVRILLRISRALPRDAVEMALSDYGVRWLDAHNNEEQVAVIGEQGSLSEAVLAQWLEQWGEQVFARIRFF